MNKEKKYKVWDKEKKRMYAPFALEEYMFSSEDKQEEMVPTYGDKIVLEWTGLKDRKGNEIYEDDLILNTAKVVWCVEWSEDRASWRYARCGSATNLMRKTSFGLTYSASTKMEVVGNLYENSELLNL